jgi:[CysO sulfur-carrier protein]-S-L-cysteine hydrolase
MLTVPAHHRAAMLAHARGEAPREACGLLAGAGGTVRRTYRMRNVSPEPETRYLADPEQQLRAFRDMERRGWEMLATYHSHPLTAAYPSPTDVERAYYPAARYVIISLAAPALVAGQKAPRATVRCFSIVQGQISEEPLGHG